MYIYIIDENSTLKNTRIGRKNKYEIIVLKNNSCLQPIGIAAHDNSMYNILRCIHIQSRGIHTDLIVPPCIVSTTIRKNV